MFRVEAGAIVFNTRSSIEILHVKDLPCEKLFEWSSVMKEFDRVQEEMQQYYEKRMKQTKRGRRE